MEASHPRWPGNSLPEGLGVFASRWRKSIDSVRIEPHPRAFPSLSRERPPGFQVTGLSFAFSCRGDWQQKTGHRTQKKTDYERNADRTDGRAGKRPDNPLNTVGHLCRETGRADP